MEGSRSTELGFKEPPGSESLVKTFKVTGFLPTTDSLSFTAIGTELIAFTVAEICTDSKNMDCATEFAVAAALFPGLIISFAVVDVAINLNLLTPQEFGVPISTFFTFEPTI